ncbi:uncharacterized protein [Penaeus vannamei]|uniref:uncharacterized protein n=1 Tax=Penaeus vannamei TaxID=6689 RepID=UPI00387F4402
MRLTPLSNSPTSSNSPGSPTPDSPLTTTLNTTTATHSSMLTSTLSSQRYSIPPSGHLKNPTNTPKITFRRHDLPFNLIYIGGESLPVRPYQPPPHLCQNCWRLGHPEKHCRTTARYPLRAQPSHNRSDYSAQSCTCANCGGPHNVFYRGCPTYKFESEVAALRYRLGLCVKPDRKHVDEASPILPTPEMSLALPLPLPPKMFLHPPLSPIPTSYFPTSTSYLHHSKSFANLEDRFHHEDSSGKTHWCHMHIFPILVTKEDRKKILYNENPIVYLSIHPYKYTHIKRDTEVDEQTHSSLHSNPRVLTPFAFQDVTKWNVWTSTEFVAQTLTSFPKPVVVTRTELLTATKYVTQAQFFTETSYVTSTESKFFTETLVATDFTTKTLPVTTYDTFTSTYYSTKIHRHTDFVTTTQYKHVTQTERHPHYLTQTLTSQYRVYETVTQTVTQNEYVTETSLHFQTNYVSKCSPKAQPTHYGGYGY